MLSVVSVSMVVAALLAVVVAQAFLANGQVRLSTLQHDLALEQSSHRQAELAVAELETPSRIVGAATSSLHMVHPSVTELPYVSLTTPLPTPNVTAAPVTTPTTSPTASTASTASTGSTASTSSTASTPSTTTPTSTP
jgi:Tfp pilus assembly protein PilX